MLSQPPAQRALPHPDELSPTIDYSSMVSAELRGPHAVHALPGALSYFGCRYATITGWRSLNLDLHVPQSEGPHPLVIYVHGGSFLGGIPTMGPWPALLQQGIAVASVDYRLAGEVSYPAPVEDVRAAVRWLRAGAAGLAIDPDRIALWGSSAGAHLALMAGLSGDRHLGTPLGQNLDTSSQVSAIIDHYGITDPAALGADAEFVDAAERERLGRLMHLYLGVDPETDPASASRADARTLLSSRQSPPLLIAHGDADSRVAIAQSRRLAEHVTALGGSVEFDIHPGAQHGDPSFESAETIRRVVDFLHTVWGG